MKILNNILVIVYLFTFPLHCMESQRSEAYYPLLYQSHHASLGQANATIALPALPHPRYRAIIFDLGGVLLSGGMHEFLKSIYGSEEAAPAGLAQALKTSHWHNWDKGHLTKDELIAALEQNNFKRQDIEKLLAAYLDAKRPLIEEVYSILKKLKSQGFKIYLLSNFSRDAYHVFMSAYETLFNEFDGMVFSFQYGLAKPFPEVYELLLKIFKLTSSESLFIDDSQINVEGGQQVGIDSILYKPGTLEKELEKHGFTFDISNNQQHDH